MGASGMGTGSVGNLTPQQLAMLLKQLMGAGAGGGGAQGGAPGGMPLPNAAPPMPQMPPSPQMGMPPPPPTPVAPQQAPNPFASMPGASGMQPQSIAGADQNAQIAKLLASLQRGQAGVSPTTAAGGNPGLMAMLANYLRGFQGNGMPGAGMMGQLQQQAATNTAAGAPGL